MSIQSIGLERYANALNNQYNIGERNPQTEQTQESAQSFSETLQDSLSKVNEMQLQSGEKVKEFASGESQNVHELMISLQKAGTAMQMTTAARSKAMEAYKSIINLRL
ncbi:MAG: flagellar hook-basal body complex protein FliE [Thermodesulfobacteriota bacterium]